MPSHYGKSNSKSNSHTMPDGTVMSGKTHSKDSKVISKSKKEEEEGIPFDELKEGSLKRMLKIKKDDPKLKIGELQKILKTKEGESFMFRGNEIKKLTPLMKKRVTLAITLIRSSKKK
tara:strand:+ start:903 stop:1256 length:354 start_codon:yes stop_codon:yes gene_type:complete